MPGKASYHPPCAITPALLNLVAEISELIGTLNVSIGNDKQSLRLRRINRIRSIRGSLAIEGNTLSEQQITAILEGKRVLAPPREILEVQNALRVYEKLLTWSPEQERHLLEAHRILMKGLIKEAGCYRRGGVGIMAGKQLIHMAPPASRVPALMRDLLGWINRSAHHPLITGAIFHYEFEFIHPFSDGNGRMGRLWQTIILSRWRKLFADLPVENIIHQHQRAYYQAIGESNRRGNSQPFVLFMLKMIRKALLESTPQVAPQVTPQVERLVKVLRKHGDVMSRAELQAALDLKDRKSFRLRYLQPALDTGLVVMTIPDKPNSRLQQYRLAK